MIFKNPEQLLGCRDHQSKNVTKRVPLILNLPSIIEADSSLGLAPNQQRKKVR
jgi:hypothetical protein